VPLESYDCFRQLRSASRLALIDPFQTLGVTRVDVVHGNTWPSIACLKFARKTDRRPDELRTFVASKGLARTS